MPLFVPEVRNNGLCVLSKFFLNILKALYVLFEGKLELIPKKFGFIIFLLILFALTLFELLIKLFFLGKALFGFNIFEFSMTTGYSRFSSHLKEKKPILQVNDYSVTYALYTLNIK